MNGAGADRARGALRGAAAAFIVLISESEICGWTDAAAFILLKAVSGAALLLCVRGAHAAPGPGKEGADDGR